MNTFANESPHFPSSVGDQPVSSGVLVETLWRHPLAILGTAALAVLGAYFYADRATPLYTSRARLFVEQEIPKVIQDPEGGFMSKRENYLYTQIEVLMSNPVLTNAVRVLGAEQMQTFATASDRTPLLQNRLAAEVGKMDGIISISFKAPRPEEAAAVVNAVVDAYIDFHVQKKRDYAAALLKVLEKTLADRDAVISEAYQRLMTFKKENENLAFGSDQANNLIMRQMERLLIQLSEAKTMTRLAKHFYETAQTLAEDPMALRQLLEAWRAQNINYTPAKRMVSGQPDRLFVQDQLGILRQEYLAAQQREEELAAQCQAQRQQVLLLNDQLATYAMLQSEYEQAKEPSDLIENRIDELSVTEGVGGLTVTVLERAMAASAPSEPQKAKIMVFALFLGTCAGVGLGFIREVCDQKIRSAQDVSALLRLPVLGVIPMIKSPMRSRILRARMVRINPVSPEAEAFRRLRTPLLLGVFREKATTVVVTSPASGDGKTIVVSNLGMALAHTGQRVLIVDADCHAPRQHTVFGRDRQQKGLTLVLAGQISLEDAIQPTGLENLDILTAGPDMCNPAEMFNSERMGQLIETLADKYDRVLIDSPPVLAFTDAQILAAQCAGAVLVLRAEVSTRKDSMQAYAELAKVDANVLGVVLNGVSRKRTGYGSDRYYRRMNSVKSIAPTNGRTGRTKGVALEPVFRR